MLDDLSDKTLRRDRPRFSVRATERSFTPVPPFRYRSYHPGDESAIMRAFNDTFAIDRDEHYWRWKFLRPDKAPMVQLAVDSREEVLAQMAGWPVDWYGSGRHIRVTQVGDLFSRRHPDVVNGKVMLRTFASFHEAYSKQTQLLCGFPNGASAGLHGAGYSLLRSADPVVTLRCGLNKPLRAVPSASLVQARKPASLLESWPDEAEADRLWQRSRDRYRLAIPRGGRWLRKRFMERADVKDYRFLGFQDADGKLNAWLVTRPLEGALWLCDLLWDGVDPQAIRRLTTAVAEQANALNLQEVRCWLQGDAVLTGLLLSQGWEAISDASQIRFAMFVYDQSLDAAQLYSHLYLTRADSDLI